MPCERQALRTKPHKLRNGAVVSHKRTQVVILNHQSICHPRTHLDMRCTGGKI